MKARALIVILILGLLIVQVNGAYESQTLHITDTEDDGFISESGNMFDTASLIYTTEASQDVRSFWVFHDVDIESTQILNNATLRLRSSNAYDFDADNSFTLYGLELQDLQDSWRPLAGMIVALPQTSAYVNVNTSNWYGYQWHEIDVTDIVKEIVTHYAWDGDASGSGDSIGFIGLGAQDETRGFYDYSGYAGYSADLIINFGDIPPDPPGLPPDSEDPELNETNQGLLIWFIDNNGENRTGAPPRANGSSVNWNLLNQTMLDEWDTGGAVTVNNDTWNTALTLRAQQIMSLWNDTLVLNVTTFFVRFAIDVTNVNCIDITPQPLVALAGISTISPDSGPGHAYDVNPGKWVGLMLQVHNDDAQFRLYLRERDNVGDDISGFSQWFTQNAGILYIEFRMKHEGIYKFIQYRVYDDPLFSNLIEDHVFAFGIAEAPFRYPQILASGGPTLGNDAYSGEYYTYLTDPLPANVSWVVTFPNGTIIDIVDTYDDALELIDEIVGTDPDNPDPPGQDYPQTGPFTRFKTRFYILILGLGTLLGPMMFLAYQYDRGLKAGQVAGAFIVMLMGLGLMLAVRQI